MTRATTDLPAVLYRAAGVRAIDARAIEDCGIPGEALMERAGAAAFGVLTGTWPSVHRIAVICGTGNNGGDGFVIARLAHVARLKVEVMIVGGTPQIRGDAARKLDAMIAAGVAPSDWEAGELDGFDLIVDALLGSGLDRDLGGDYLAAVQAINRSRVAVLAVDIPSGLNADTGQPMGEAVVASATVTFVGMKQGLVTGAAADHCGRLYFSDLEIPAPAYEAFAPTAHLADRAGLIGLLPRRHRDSHKGHYGHVLIVGGDRGYAGAARLAAEAAARIGAGLTSVATRSEHAAVLNLARPEVMSHGVESRADLLPRLRTATVVAIGPGLGQSPWAAELLACVLEADLPVVVDADALNLLSQDPVRNENWILTPHPGEAARLLGCTSLAVQADRYAAVRAVQTRYGGICVLKGAGTLIADAIRIHVCVAGNPGMASGGMGDALTGVLSGLLAQGLAPGDAARLGVCLHAEAADRAAVDGERGLLARDLMPWLRRLAN